MKIFLLPYLLILFFQYSIAQNNLYVEAKEKGNGFFKEKNGNCYIITPYHVVSNSNGKITVLDKNRNSFYAELLEVYEPDLAVLKLHENKLVECLNSKHNEQFESILENHATGFIEYIDELGTTNIIHVKITAKDVQSIAVKPIDSNESLKKGMSGSSFYIQEGDKKILAGMLMSIEDDLKTGYIFQIDDIDRILHPFFYENKVRKVGIVFKNTQPKISSKIITSFNNNDKIKIISNFNGKSVLISDIQNIFSGNFNKNKYSKLKNTLDNYIFIESNITQSKNQNNLFVTRINLEAYYFKADMSLEKNITIYGKGINANKSIAENQAITSLITNFKKQIQ